MKTTTLLSFVALFTTGLVGCVGSSTETTTETTTEQEPPVAQSAANIPSTRHSNRPLPASIVELMPASCDTQSDLSGGRSYRVEMPSRVDGAAIVFQVFEPSTFDCQNGHPLILQGHGFSGSRTTEAGTDPLAPIAPLVEAGYAVISIDQRGHGESGGTVRVMDPDLEGQDLIQITDWAEAHLDYLKYRKNNLLLGAVGGSYGGGFQYLLYNVDPDQRMDAMVPQITWHDLTYSLNPGNVTKNYWLAFLSAAGDSGTGFSMDPYLRSSLLEGISTGLFPDSALAFLHYHSPSYFWQNEFNLALLDSGNTNNYLVEPVTGQLPVTSDGRFIVKTPPREPYPVDVLMFQGMRDSLFPFNDAADNYEVLKAAGGDVRLLTYPFSHHYLAPNVGLIQETLANLTFYSGELPTLANEGLNALTSCGNIRVNDATVAWFNDKLLGLGNADDVISTGQQICYTLTPGDAVSAPDITVGGRSYDASIDVLGQSLPATVLSGAAGTVPTIVPLETLGEEAIVAGIPTASLTVSTGLSELDAQCLESSDPVLQLGTCDSIIFVGVGVIRNDAMVPELVDEQVMPLRGLGQQDVELTGIAERLQAGDQLVLMLYGQHPTFAGAFSRDLVVPKVQVTGQVAIPLLSPDGQSQL